MADMKVSLARFRELVEPLRCWCGGFVTSTVPVHRGQGEKSYAIQTCQVGHRRKIEASEEPDG